MALTWTGTYGSGSSVDAPAQEIALMLCARQV
jgi:hypothetical protein